MLCWPRQVFIITVEIMCPWAQHVASTLESVLFPLLIPVTPISFVQHQQSQRRLEHDCTMIMYEGNFIVYILHCLSLHITVEPLDKGYIRVRFTIPYREEGG